MPSLRPAHVERVGARVLEHGDLALRAADAHVRGIGDGDALDDEPGRGRAGDGDLHGDVARDDVVPLQVDAGRIDLVDLHARRHVDARLLERDVAVLAGAHVDLEVSDVVGVAARRASCAGRAA